MHGAPLFHHISPPARCIGLRCGARLARTRVHLFTLEE